MRDHRRLFFIGQILLMTLMLSGMLELGGVAHASIIPQDASIVSFSLDRTLSADHGEVAHAAGIVSWHQLYATHSAKYPKVKSALPCQQWVPLMVLLASTLQPRADVPSHVFADTYCYAIHPRPPTPLTA